MVFIGYDPWAAGASVWLETMTIVTQRLHAWRAAVYNGFPTIFHTGITVSSLSSFPFTPFPKWVACTNAQETRAVLTFAGSGQDRWVCYEGRFMDVSCEVWPGPWVPNPPWQIRCLVGFVATAQVKHLPIGLKLLLPLNQSQVLLVWWLQVP